MYKKRSNKKETVVRFLKRRGRIQVFMDRREGQERWSRDTDKRRVGEGNVEVKRITTRIIKIKLVLEGNLMHVISAYAPQGKRGILGDDG